MNKLSGFGKKLGNISEYFGDSEIVPFAQWMNPQKKRPIGLAINKEQAKLAKFSGCQGWEEKTVKFGSKSEEFYVSTNPSLIVLNGSNVITKEVKGNPRQIFMSDDSGEISLFSQKEKQGKMCFSYLVFVIANEKGEIVSDPIRIKLNKKSTFSLFNVFEKEFKPYLLGLFPQMGINIPGGQDPNCALMARFIYKPLIEEGEVTSGAGASSEAAIAVGFEKLTDATYDALVVNEKDVERVQEMVKNVMSFVKVRGVEKEEMVAVETETGEVEMTPEMLELISEPTGKNHEPPF